MVALDFVQVLSANHATRKPHGRAEEIISREVWKAHALLLLGDDVFFSAMHGSCHTMFLTSPPWT